MVPSKFARELERENARLREAGAPCSLYSNMSLRVEMKINGRWYPHSNWREDEITEAHQTVDKLRGDSNNEEVRLIRMRFEVLPNVQAHQRWEWLARGVLLGARRVTTTYIRCSAWLGSVVFNLRIPMNKLRSIALIPVMVNSNIAKPFLPKSHPWKYKKMGLAEWERCGTDLAVAFGVILWINTASALIICIRVLFA